MPEDKPPPVAAASMPTVTTPSMADVKYQGPVETRTMMDYAGPIARGSGGGTLEERHWYKSANRTTCSNGSTRSPPSWSWSSKKRPSPEVLQLQNDSAP